MKHKIKVRTRRHPVLRALLWGTLICAALAMASVWLFGMSKLWFARTAHNAYKDARNVVSNVIDVSGSNYPVYKYNDVRDGSSHSESGGARDGKTYPLDMLVNRWNPVPDDLSVELCDIGGGKQVDVRCRDDLMAMLESCRADGHDPLICSAYRTNSYQSNLYDNKVQRLKNEGLSDDEARIEAATVVALPGTSEHQTGLALDIVDESYQALDEDQENTAVQRWLMKNSWRYGFILRYPTGKSSVTGIIYEPWHYRYVGRDLARAIYESGLCMEEYLEQR